MYCENCGNKNDDLHKFCTKCGQPIAPAMSAGKPVIEPDLDQKWWHRLLKVAYIFLYLQILWIVPVVWSTNSSSYAGVDTYGEAFWNSLLAIVIFMVVIRLIKFTVLYIALAQKPQWKKEFKKFF